MKNNRVENIMKIYKNFIFDSIKSTTDVIADDALSVLLNISNIYGSFSDSSNITKIFDILIFFYDRDPCYLRKYIEYVIKILKQVSTQNDTIFIDILPKIMHFLVM